MYKIGKFQTFLCWVPVLVIELNLDLFSSSKEICKSMHTQLPIYTKLSAKLSY